MLTSGNTFELHGGSSVSVHDIRSLLGLFFRRLFLVSFDRVRGQQIHMENRPSKAKQSTRDAYQLICLHPSRLIRVILSTSNIHYPIRAQLNSLSHLSLSLDIYI